MGVPMVIRSRAYLMASSMARLATPTAPEATGGRVLSKAPMATLKPAPSAPSTLDEGTTTLSKKSGPGGPDAGNARGDNDTRDQDPSSRLPPTP